MVVVVMVEVIGEGCITYGGIGNCVCVPLSMTTGYISTHDNTTNNTFRSL